MTSELPPAVLRLMLGAWAVKTRTSTKSWALPVVRLREVMPKKGSPSGMPSMPKTRTSLGAGPISISICCCWPLVVRTSVPGAVAGAASSLSIPASAPSGWAAIAVPARPISASAMLVLYFMTRLLLMILDAVSCVSPALAGDVIHKERRGWWRIHRVRKNAQTVPGRGSGVIGGGGSELSETGLWHRVRRAGGRQRGRVGYGLIGGVTAARASPRRDPGGVSGMPTQSLLERCRAGDQGAWRSLVDAYAGLVYAVARAHRLPADVCDDVAQNSFAALAANIHRVQSDLAVAAWLRTTATRESWRAGKKLRRSAGAGPEDQGAESPAEAELEEIEEHQRLRRAMERLDERCRRLLSALYFTSHGESYDGISARLGLPRGSIGPTRQRCLQRLCELFVGDDAG
ncbi:MAG: hypothetical protein C0468_05020 [Planctomyces sp.]|nr:hypothetical protein [Planctomyces sp.]